MSNEEKKKKLTRRELIASILQKGAVLGIGAGAGVISARSNKGDLVWQIDPNKCTRCGKCATECVLNPSAVKCYHHFPRCGYCEFCFGFFRPGSIELDTGAENLLCPVDALKRKFIEYPYFEYTVDDDLCIGCGKCVEGCNTFGNGSLYLQVMHDRCVNCNECSIARNCPSQAFIRVPADRPYVSLQE
jgi:electron transport complex protein RnfB